MTRDPLTPDPLVLDFEAERVELEEWEAESPYAVDDAAPQADLPAAFAFIGAVLGSGFLVSWWIPGILAGLLVVLFMHELGHYLTARASGMKVTEFFLGFGPKIWSFKRGETEYGIKLILAGAYVRIMGMTNLDDIDPAEEHRTYRAQPYWQRMMTICAGSAMHFLMAIVALVVLFASHGYNGFNGPPWFVNEVVPGSTASSLGIELGDQIVSVNGDGFDNWDEFGQVVSSLEEGPVEIVINRDGQELRLNGDLGLRPEDVLLDGFGLKILDEEPDAPWEAAYIWPQDQADQFGIQVGDVIVSAGGVDTPTETTMAAMLRDRNGDAIEFQVLRDGEPMTLQGTVDLNTTAPFRGFFGVGPIFVPEGEPSTVAAVGRAVDDFGVIAWMNIEGIVDLINPARWLGFDEPEVERRAALQFQGSDVPLPQAEGQDTNRPLSVVGIGRLIAESDGVDQVLFMFAVVNIFIGLFNLAPVLPVDGGHALIATYERARELVTRRPHRVDAAKLIPVTWVVIMLLVGVGAWTFALDIFAWPTT